MNKKPKLTAHTIIKNEENWIWYSITSVIDYVDEIIVWDTGSTDHTIEIVNSIASPKLKFHQEKNVTPASLTFYRQQMLQITSHGWILILDGDEVWTPDSLNSSLGLIHSSTHYNYLISSYSNLIGDIYHRQPENAGKYQLGDYTGHKSIRFINLDSITGLHYDQPYPSEGLFDSQNQLIQNNPNYLSGYVSDPYLHMTHLPRTGGTGQKTTMMRKKKFKYELGLPLSADFTYPPCIYFPRSNFIPSPWMHRSLFYLLNSSWQTPIKYLKRIVIK